jgi:hypothetical protein
LENKRAKERAKRQAKRKSMKQSTAAKKKTLQNKENRRKSGPPRVPGAK